MLEFVALYVQICRLTSEPVIGLPQHSSTIMTHMASHTDHETTKGFSLLTSLRQHFAALRQQDASVAAPQVQSDPNEFCTPYWGQSYDPQSSSGITTVLGSQALTSPDRQHGTARPAKHPKTPSKSSLVLHNTKLGCHKRRQHHRRHKHPQEHQKQILHYQHPALHLLAEDHPETGQRFQLEPAYPSAPPEAVNCEAAATRASGHTLQFHHMCQNACMLSLGCSSTPNQQSSLKQLYNPMSSPHLGAAMLAEPCTTQASAHNSHLGCIRAQPRLMWQNSLKPTDSHAGRTDVSLRVNQGRQSAHTFQIASDLSKAGQLCTQNLHAAVRGSLQLMHRFVVRRSAIAHMGVFTTGISLACASKFAHMQTPVYVSCLC